MSIEIIIAITSSSLGGAVLTWLLRLALKEAIGSVVRPMINEVKADLRHLRRDNEREHRELRSDVDQLSGRVEAIHGDTTPKETPR